MAEGSITIDILAKTDKFDKQIKKLEDRMQKEENKKIEKEIEIQNLENEFKKYDEAVEKVKKYKQEIEELEKSQKALFTEKGGLPHENLKEYNNINNEIESATELLKKQENLVTIQESKFESIEAKLEKAKLQHQEITEQITKYNQQIENVQVEKLKKGLDGVGTSLESSIKKVARLALGIFGLRSAYMALRRASSDLASYDEQYATNLEYIRYALTQAVAPVLRYIVNLAATLLQYINMILNALFGINIFSRGSAESFNKMKTGASGVSKAVKEIKKQLAGFDEINMLTDQSDTGTAGGAGGVGMPSFDLSALNAEPPKWLQWIIDNKDGILSTLAGIAGGLAFLKLGEIARDLGLIQGRLLGIKAIGFGLLIKGIIDLVSSLRKYLKDPSWENFGKVIKSIGEIILGVGLLIGNVPLIVAGAITLIIGLIIQHWEDIKQFFQNGIDWLADKSEWVHNMFDDTIGNIYDFFVARLQAMLNFVDEIFKSLKTIFDGFIEFFRGVFTGNWEQAFNGLKQIARGVLDGILGLFNYFGNLVKDKAISMGTTIGNVFGGAFKAVVNSVLSAVERILNSPIRAINNLIGTINEVPGINLGYLNTFNLPRMKRGGILNVPNKGTLVGGGTAIAGESGHEGYIPLTDQQAMSELGAEIGKNVIINLTNITTMNGRVIGREVKQVQSEQAFAYNK